jgi:hypothetical protein
LRYFVFILSLFFFISSAEGQNESFIRAVWSNDFTIKKDRYESNVIQVDYFHSGRSITRYFLPGLGQSYFGYGLRHGIYTPWKKSWSYRLSDDHPYGGTLSVEFSRLSVSEDSKWMLSTHLSAGVLGPAAGAKYLQNGIHALLPASVPKGWDNQIRNEAIFSYRAELNRLLFRTQSVEASAFAGLVAGSPRTAVYPGLLVRMGNVADRFFGRVPGRSSHLTAFIEFGSNVQMTRYNRFHEETEIESEPVYLQGHVAFNVTYRSWMFRIGQTFNTPEFKGASHHGQGFLNINFGL